MQVNQNKNTIVGEQPASITKKTDNTNLSIPQENKEPVNNSKKDSSKLESKLGKASSNISLVDPPKDNEDKKPKNTKDKLTEKKTTEVSNKQSESQKSSFKLKSVEVGGSILNDSNFLVKNEDDLGMTTSYTAHTNLSFSGRNNSKTNIFLNNNSALHTQFLSKENNVTKQSLLTTQDFEIGINNNKIIGKNPDFSFGAKIQYKNIDTNPNSGWANFQKSFHDLGHLRQYDNQENPFVNDQSYVTPMITMDYEKEKIGNNKLYFKSEVKAAAGMMIPMQQNSNFYTPVRADAYGSVKFGYSHNSMPLIYVKADANLSNEPLPYNRDHGTAGSVGLAIGNEISLAKKKKMDVSLLLETKVVQPFGNLPNNPLPDQYGKHDMIHEMFNLKLKINLK